MRDTVVFIAGQRGSGKSYYAKQYGKTLSRCIVYDSLGEYREHGQVFRDLGALIDHMQQYQDSQFLTAVYDPTTAEDFPLFCRACMACGNITVILEELDTVSTPTRTCPELQELMKRGRHNGISLVGVTRRPAEVSRLFTSQANRFVIFRQFEHADVQYFKSIIGPVAEQIPHLEKYHYIDYDFETDNPGEQPIKPPI